jgi:tRNA (guanine37-N1)-methyltransferase
VQYRIFTLHPDIFTSFLANSLIARGQAKDIISVNLVNWREKYGVGEYKQVDDKPFGGGHGMVLQPEPIYQALHEFGGVSSFFKELSTPEIHNHPLPNNSNFYTKSDFSKVTISLTPRGFRLNQQMFEWLARFQEMNILCGRYEGFDARVSDMIDLELSLGDFVLNGGEVAAMSLVEGVSRLIPGFVTKSGTVMHDSFSSSLNHYEEQREFVIGKHNLNTINQSKKLSIDPTLDDVLNELSLDGSNIFDDIEWARTVLPRIEHPQYTRPSEWRGLKVPDVLLEGNHKKIQDWRTNWYK